MQDFNNLELIRCLNELIRTYFVNSKTKATNNKAFVKDSQDLLFKFLDAKLGDNLVHLVLTYVKNNKTIITTDDGAYKFGNAVSDQYKTLVNNYLNDIKNGEFTSFTKALLLKHEGFDVILESAKQYESPIKTEGGNSKIQFFSVEDLEKLKSRESGEQMGFIQNDEDLTRFEKLITHYKYFTEELKKKEGIEGTYFQFLRPYYMDLEYNILVGITTTKRLDTQLLVDINNFAFRVVSQMSKSQLEYENEMEESKTRRTFNLYTHSLKTQLDTTVVKLKNKFKDRIAQYSDLHLPFQSLDDEIEELYKLTSLVSLIDKIGDEKQFCDTGIASNFLSESKLAFDLKNHLDRFNGLNKALPDIFIEPDSIKSLELELKVYNYYLGDIFWRLFFNTLFENITKFGKPNNKKVVLNIQANDSSWVFTNETVDEAPVWDEPKLKGNLKFFQMLLVETDSGQFSITPEKNIFRIEIKAKK